LPGTLGYKGLVTCTRQTDCNSCKEQNQNVQQLECVTVNNVHNQILDPNTKTLNPPAPIHLFRPANGVCSGRGSLKTCDDPNAPDNCNTDVGWCDCGSSYASANNDPSNCDVQVLQVTQPGSYCLPSYVNACNPATSDTVLSNSGSGSQWVCECKYPDLFVQNNEGSDCTVPIACGSLEPQVQGNTTVKVLSYNSNDPSCTQVTTNQSPWKLCNSYPNTMVSSNILQNVPCSVPTYNVPVKLDDIHSYEQYNVSPYADPKCQVYQYSNTCTVQWGYKGDGTVPFVNQVIRGSGNVNDPIQTRIWPPYPEPLPLGMQRCPDKWSGDGTPQNPCVPNPNPNSYKLVYLDQYGQWNGKYLSLQDLRNTGYTGPDATPCDAKTPCSSTSPCTPAGICAPLCSEGSANCVNGVVNFVTDSSCVNGVGIPGTLGAIPWATVNSQCQLAPTCLEEQTTLQKVTRDLTAGSPNIFPLSSNSTSSCSTKVTAPNCYCPLKGKNIKCTPDGNECAQSSPPGVCVTSPDTSAGAPKTCASPSDCDSNQFCLHNVCSVGYCTCGPDGSGLVCEDAPDGTSCTAADGTMIRPYNGQLDGPPVDDNREPSGAACNCSGFVLDGKGNKVPLIPGNWLNNNIRFFGVNSPVDDTLDWACVPDPCYIPGSQSAYNPLTNQCNCTSDNTGATYYPWISQTGVPTCQRDPCNPGGTTSNVQVTCAQDSDCSESAVTCTDQQCYILTDQTCDMNGGPEACQSIVGAGGINTVKCIQVSADTAMCAVKDPSRSSCNQSSDCALGICNSTSKLCTGGCLCNNGLDQFYTDNNPLHAACANPCTFNPCGPNGVCSTTSTQKNDPGKVTCTCNPGYTGESCEYRSGCLGPNAHCKHDAQCCSESCSFQWFPGGDFYIGYACD
jgi:hypothetical protein